MVTTTHPQNGINPDPAHAPTYRARSQMLRELLYHQEAAYKTLWQYPPIQPGTNLTSYAEMMLDPAVAFGINLIKESILAQGWDIEPPEDASTGSVAMTHEIRANLRNLDTEAALDDGLSAIWRGFWAQEITWQHKRRAFELVSLASMNPDQMALRFNDHMRITELISRPLTGGHAPQTVSADKLWFHVHRPSRTRPAGSSLLDTAYRAWSSKNRLLQFWGLAIQRFGSAQWLLTVPSNTPTERQAQILSIFSAGRLDGVYMSPEDVAATQINPPQWANQTYESAIQYQDSEILRAILLESAPGAGASSGHIVTTGTALEVRGRATAHRLKRISRELADSFDRQVIHPLCLANWGAPPAQCPRLKLAAPDQNRIAVLGAAMTQLVTTGITDRATAAEELGLPDPPAKLDVLAAPTPPAGTPQNGQH